MCNNAASATAVTGTMLPSSGHFSIDVQSQQATLYIKICFNVIPLDKYHTYIYIHTE